VLALDAAAQVGAGGFAHGPVDDGGVADSRRDFSGDGSQLEITQDVNGAVISGESVVEGDFVPGEAERIAPFAGCSEIGHSREASPSRVVTFARSRGNSSSIASQMMRSSTAR
jgi:hypothetical protein